MITIGVLEMSDEPPTFGKIEPGVVLPVNRSQQQPHPRGDDRQQITRAREAAAVLFRPKQLIEPLAPETPSPAESTVRKPRVPTIASAAPVQTEGEAPVSPKQQMTPKIPRSQFARIRAWVQYGMTVDQVAEVCGVAVGDIERILRKA